MAQATSVSWRPWIVASGMAIGGILAFGLVGAREAQALVKRYDLDSLARRSSLILTGEVRDLRSHRGPLGRLGEVILTDVTIRVDRIFEGALDGADVTVQVLGGTADGLSQRCADSPAYERGERVLVFLREWNGGLWNTGWLQGKYRLSADGSTVMGRATLPISGEVALVAVESRVLHGASTSAPRPAPMPVVPAASPEEETSGHGDEPEDRDLPTPSDPATVPPGPDLEAGRDARRRSLPAGPGRRPRGRPRDAGTRRRSIGRWSLGILLATLAVAPLGSRAYETLGPKWTLRRADYCVNANFPDKALTGTTERQIELQRCAASGWREQTRANFEFVYKGTTTIRKLDTKDGVNAAFWTSEDGGDALAVCLFDPESIISISAFDIAFFNSTDGELNRWNGKSVPPANTYDLPGVSIHEFGHALGLDHTDVLEATMYPYLEDRTGVHQRTLHADDIAGAEFLYGTRTSVAAKVEITRVTPPSGSTLGGNEVAIEGVNFTYSDDTTLTMDTTQLAKDQWTIECCGRIRVLKMPAHGVGPVGITVKNSIGSATKSNAYTFEIPQPLLSAVSPKEGPVEGGIAVTLTGKDFTPGAKARFGDMSLIDAFVAGPTSIRGTVPPGSSAGPVDVTVEQGGLVATLTQGFTYKGAFLRGDTDSDGVINLTDAVFLLVALFRGGPQPACLDAGDANDDGDLDLTDGVHILLFLFQGGDPPMPPFPEPGEDPTQDALGC